MTLYGLGLRKKPERLRGTFHVAANDRGQTFADCAEALHADDSESIQTSAQTVLLM